MNNEINDFESEMEKYTKWKHENNKDVIDIHIENNNIYGIGECEDESEIINKPKPNNKRKANNKTHTKIKFHNMSNESKSILLKSLDRILLYVSNIKEEVRSFQSIFKKL